MIQEPKHLRRYRIGILTYDFDPPIGGLGVLVRTYLDTMKTLFPADTTIVISPSAHADEHSWWLGRVRYRKAGGCPLFSLSLLFSLPRILCTHSLDILHVHAGSGGVFLLRRPVCPLVVTAHHTYRQEAELVYPNSPIKKFWKLCMARLEARTYHIADAIICVSKDTADAIMTDYGVPASRVIVIENPVNVPDIEALRRSQKHPDSLIFVGRMEPRKGIFVLLEAFQMLLRDIPTAKLRLVGSNMLGPKLPSTIRSRGLEKSVTVLGFLTNPVRLKETAASLALIVPSTLEGFGLVAAEAMMLGTCVIGSDAPGLRSIITNGKTGMTFPASNATALCQAMKHVLADDASRKNLEQEAKREATIRFCAESRARDVHTVYARILEKA